MGFPDSQKWPAGGHRLVIDMQRPRCNREARLLCCLVTNWRGAVEARYHTVWWRRLRVTQTARAKSEEDGLSRCCASAVCVRLRGWHPARVLTGTRNLSRLGGLGRLWGRRGSPAELLGCVAGCGQTTFILQREDSERAGVLQVVLPSHTPGKVTTEAPLAGRGNVGCLLPEMKTQ